MLVLGSVPSISLGGGEGVLLPAKVMIKMTMAVWICRICPKPNSQSSMNGKNEQTTIMYIYIIVYSVFLLILVSKLCLLWQWQHCQF